MKALAEVCGVYELHLLNKTYGISENESLCHVTIYLEMAHYKQLPLIESSISDIKMLKTFSHAEKKSLSSIHVSFSYILHTSV